MSDLLFYYSKNKNVQPEHPELFTSFRKIHSSSGINFWSSGKPSGIYHYTNTHIAFYLIGNFNFYNTFHVDLNLLVHNNGVNKAALQNLLRQVNGIYTCILLNTATNQVHIVTDFLGFYPLYMYRDQEQVIFSSEIKHFKLFDKIQMSFDEDSMYSYLHNGHLMLTQSWFKEIDRTRPATIYTLALGDGSLNSEYYWTWSEVHKVDLPKKEIISRYADLFHKGIETLDLPANSKTAVSLSGGLDSRWIAQIASNHFNTEAFTFSSGKNFESSLAEKVANALEIKHRQPIITKEEWLSKRLDAFWKTDGMLHLGHLHEGNLHKEVHQSYSHCFHGFYGGGIYASAEECNQKITDEFARAHFKFNNAFTNTQDPFYETNSIDPYIADQKIRYQSAYSIYLLSGYCKMIIPFYNIDWLEFNYSIDGKLQLHSKLYLEVLNAELNPGLLSIPWQRTGIAPRYVYLNGLNQKLRIPAILEKTAQLFNTSRHFINYHDFDNEINYWLNEFKPDISNLQLNYSIKSREEKLRMLSLAVWLKMISKNSPDVI